MSKYFDVREIPEGHFNVGKNSEGCFNVGDNPEGYFDIIFSYNYKIDPNKIPEEQKNLHLNIEDTLNILRTLKYTSDEKKKNYYDKILKLSRAGLVSISADPRQATEALEKVKNEILITEGIRIKNNYMKDLGIAILGIGFITILVYLIPYINNQIKMYILVWLGSMIGVWVSFGARKFNIKFHQLSIIEEDFMSPFIRIIFVGICSIIFALFINTGIITVKFGNFSTAEIKNIKELQILLGILCGLVESKLGKNIHQKAEEIITPAEKREDHN